MARFEPFAGVRYDPARVDLNTVTAPPYDVIGPEEQARLESRSPYNVVHVDLSRDEAGRDRYTAAGCRFDEWLGTGVLVTDPEPSFYVYELRYRDERGHPRTTVGAIGALELSVPGEGDVLAHERTMPKPKGDRLRLQRACRANVSPVWGLSLAGGLAQLCRPPAGTGPPVTAVTDEDGVEHRLWRVTNPATLRAIGAAVASAPVVIADGHHRYETALAYRDEVRAAGTGTGTEDLLMALVVELADDQLTVRAINRLLSGLPTGFDVLVGLAELFEPVDAGVPARQLRARMDDGDALGLVTRGRAWLLRPRPGAFLATPAAAEDLDSVRLDVALDRLPPHELTYQPADDEVVARVEAGEQQAGFLLRPATVDQIAAAAHARRRMPEKSTFFWPKPRTGMVFRRLE